MNKYDEIIYIKTVSEYINYIDLIVEKSNKPNKQFVFRGENKQNNNILPGLLRTNDSGKRSYYEEKEILLNFINEAIAHLSHIRIDEYTLWIAYAQHFGTPTRIIDFTLNMLTALYFACTGEKDEDGVVYIIDLMEYIDNITNNSKYIKNINKPATNEDIINGIMSNILYNDDCIEYPFPYAPVYIDNRMSAQSSIFMLWGSIHKPLEQIIDTFKNKTLVKIGIPHDDKSSIIKQLDLCGINSKTLFPGLDGIGQYMKVKYRV